MMDEWLSLHDAATQLDVHYMTVYRYVRLGLLPAIKVGPSWRIDREDMAEFVRQRAGIDRTSGPKASRVDWSDRYEARLVAGDRQGAWLVIGSCQASGATTAEVYLTVIAPALERIGERWAVGEIDVFHEHRATMIVRQHLGRLSPLFVQRGLSRGTIMLGCAPGERHDIGLSMVADLFRQAGFDCLDLGSDVPTESFEIGAKATDSLAGVGISINSRDLIDSAAEVVRRLHTVVPEAKIVVGGKSLTDADNVRLGAHYVANDTLSAVLWMTEWAKGRPFKTPVDGSNHPGSLTS